jgi:membrane protein
MAFARARAAFVRVRAMVRRVIDTVPVVRTLVDGMVRIELIDRSMAIAAQAMLALVPMLAVLAAFLPAEFTTLALERFREVTGIGAPASEIVDANVDAATVRAQTGLVGILITVFSATSFARAVQRMYERVWEQPHVGGILGLRRSFLWLVGWLLTIQTVSAIGFVLSQVDGFDVVRFLVQGITGTLVWWWTTRMLLFNRVSWRRLAVGALLTGFSLVLYSWGSSLVMPTYVEQSAQQLGTLGLILAVTTWLVGFAAVLVVASVVGRALVEDEDVTRLSGHVTSGAARLRVWASGLVR